MDTAFPQEGYLDRFHGHLVATGKSPHNIVAYTPVPSSHRDELQASDGEPQAVQSLGFLRWAMETGLISADPIEGIS